MGMLAGKRAMIFGVANERSIAWSIAKALHDEGAELGFTYQGEVLERRVRPLAESVNSPIFIPCDVTSDEQIEEAFRAVKNTWDSLHILVHSIAFADKESLTRPFSETPRAGFQKALDVSAYSLVALARHAAPLMENRDASILTMTYYGSEKVVQGYNVMGVAKAALEASVRYLAEDLGPRGIRVNAISAGPIKTLAAAGIPGFRSILHAAPERAPLRRNVEGEDIGRAAVFLAGPLSAGVTGEVLYVDAGLSTIGL
jgi:enoyl-[acyl-carrier protein] reductase I